MELLTVESVAQILKVDTETVYRWLRSRKLRGIKLGDSVWRISDTDLNDFMQNPESSKSDASR